MSVIAIAFLLIVVDPAPVNHDESCLSAEALRRIDASWEKALLEGDEYVLRELLAEDFVWVHDHASTIDSRESLLEWATGGSGERNTVSRAQSQVETRRLGQTGIVMGYTVVTRSGGSTRYRFMRTYAELDGGCRLLANQTMAMPVSADNN